MNPFASYRLHFTPLSPIHIGTGESYEPTNYIIEDGALHEFDTGAAMGALSGKDREELLRIASGKPDARMLLTVQKYFFNRRKDLIPWAINCFPVASGVGRIYLDRIGKAAQVEAAGRIIVNELAIDRTGYNPVTCKPILFGSSLKGAMRTALLDWGNDGQPVQRVEDRRTGRMRKENNQELQQRLLDFRAGKFELDPLRLVQVADAMWLDESGLPATQVSFAVNRYKKDARDKHGNALNPKTDKGPDQLLECVPGWRHRAFAAQLNVQQVNGIPDTGYKGQRQLPATDLRFNVAQIAQACNAFYWPILLKENETLRLCGFLDRAWDQTMQKLLEMTHEKMDQGQAFLLRVGRHSGAESVTLNGVRDIKIMEGKDPQTHKQRFSFADAAKTLWLAANDKDQRTGLLPFGWLLVEIEPWEQPPRDWPELAALCEPHLVAARAFAAQLASQREAMAETRAAAEAQRRAETEAARQQAERAAQEARQEAEWLAALATMSEEAQRVEQFRKRMELEKAQWIKQGIGGQWFQALRTLAQEAMVWPAGDKSALLALVQDISQLDAGLSPKKNDHIKKLIRSLSA